jgi:predicted P-loop ATPase
MADNHWLKINRDQLWAEAAAREALGETIWLDDDALILESSEVQANRMVEDTWESTIMEWALGRPQVKIGDVLSNALTMAREKHTRREVLRVADILRRNGWERTTTRSLGGKERVWVRIQDSGTDEP